MYCIVTFVISQVTIYVLVSFWILYSVLLVCLFTLVTISHFISLPSFIMSLDIRWRESFNFFKLVLVLLLFNYLFFFLAAPHGMWDLSSLARDRTRAPCSGSTVLTAGPPGKYHHSDLTHSIMNIANNTILQLCNEINITAMAIMLLIQYINASKQHVIHLTFT